MNGDKLNNVRHVTNGHFRTKQRKYLKSEVNVLLKPTVTTKSNKN